MALILKLVSWTEGTEEELVLHTKQIPVWIKAAIDQNHLRRTKRRMPKGSLAQQNAKRRRQEESEAELNTETSRTNEELIVELTSRFHAFSEEQKLRIRSVFTIPEDT